MKKSKVENKGPAGIALFDPFAGLGRMEYRKWREMPDGQRPPRSWVEVPPDQRPRLGGVVSHVIEVHGPVSRARLAYLHARTLEVVRATWVSTLRGGHGHDLRPYFIQDPEERAKWRELDLTLQSMAALPLLDELILALGAQGDVRATLLERRRRIDAELARLGGDDPDFKDAA